VLTRAGGAEELRREGLHQAIDRQMIDDDAALGEQLIDIPV